MDALTAFGLLSVSAMLVRAGGSRTLVRAIWAVIAFRRWRNRIAAVSVRT
jgi:hypothetical protein